MKKIYGKFNNKLIYSEVQSALNLYGSKYLRDYELKYMYSGKFCFLLYDVRENVCFINKSDAFINGTEEAKLNGIKLRTPYNDYWALRAPANDDEFWKTWNEFKRIFNLKSFW